MNIWVVLCVLGGILQGFGLWGYMSSTTIVETHHTEEYIERVIDRETGKQVSVKKGGTLFDHAEWKLVPRKAKD